MKKNIAKLLMGTISDEELIALRKWLEDPKNRSTLESYVRDYYDLNLAMLRDNVGKAYERISEQIERKEGPVKRLVPNWTKYAAALVLLFGIGFIFQQGFFSSHNKIPIIPKNEPITLELENGETRTIDVSRTKETEVRDASGNIIGSQKQHRLSYSHNADAKDLVFNTLIVPNGKRFELVLSDGTSVHLNAGSSLRYPVNFLGNGKRPVYLSGEAYFDVTRNKSAPFIVNVDELEVKVLGTKFNVSAYDEDKDIEVVLVKGAVSLDDRDGSPNGPTDLAPGQKGSFEHASKTIEIGQVDTALYTAWMRGHLVFRNLTFDQILAKLERHLNIEIENKNTGLGKEVFNASFNNDVEIGEVLGYFNDVHEIDYEIEGNKVIIK